MTEPDSDLINAVAQYLDLADQLMPLYAELHALQTGPLKHFDGARGSDPRGMADALLEDPPPDPVQRARWMAHLPKLREHEAAYIACGAAAVSDRIEPLQGRSDELEPQICHQKPATVAGAVAQLRFLLAYQALYRVATSGPDDPGDWELDLTKAGERALVVIERTHRDGR